MLPASSSFDFVERKIYENIWKDLKFPDFICFVQVVAALNMMGLQWHLPKQE